MPSNFGMEERELNIEKVPIHKVTPLTQAQPIQHDIIKAVKKTKKKTTKPFNPLKFHPKCTRKKKVTTKIAPQQHLFKKKKSNFHIQLFTTTRKRKANT